MTAGVAGDEFYVRATIWTVKRPPHDLNPYPDAPFNPALAILRYVENTGLPKSGVPSPSVNQVEPLTAPREPVRLTDQHILPHGRKLAPDYFDEEVVITFNRGTSVDGYPYFTTNGRRYEVDHGGPPNLFQSFWNQSLPDTSIPLYTGTGSGRVIQVVINNHHRTHPIHLHGHHFWVVGQGREYGVDYNATEHAGLLRRDVVLRDTTRFPASWFVIRYIADNPGVWLLHCHVSWHVAAGMAAVIVEGEDTMRDSLMLPSKSLNACAASEIIPP